MSNTSLPMATNKLSGSFVSLNTDTASEDDPTHEYKEFRKRVRVYMNIFSEHVYDNDHPFKQIARQFAKCFSHYVQDNIKELYQLKNTGSEQFMPTYNSMTEEVIYNLQKFIIKLQTALRLMYGRTVNYHCFIEEKDEFINLITGLIIREGRLYENLFELVQIGLYDQVKVLESKFNEFKDIRPEDLGIQDKFCLNERTVAFQKKLLDENQQKVNSAGKSENSMYLFNTRDQELDEEIKFSYEQDASI
jgi:hypothetical protein